MRDPLRQVDGSKPPGVVRRAFSRIALTRGLLFFSRHVSWKLDPVLLSLSRGRIASTGTIPTAVLQTRGARTGELRRNAVIYWRDGDAAVIAASQAGGPNNPSWVLQPARHPGGRVRQSADASNHRGGRRGTFPALGGR
ncbi:MAG: nitroreductase family deazaflavin-dependent oxidoreductase [Acidimicrobiia bacterium]|nr:nitroreductase family deazaflavin-dependent oxidoreductase [Acidimicrobiia bacterium]